MEVQECTDLYNDGNDNAKWISRCCAAALVGLFMREVLAFIFICVEQKDVDREILALPDARISSGLLCSVLLFLSITEIVLAISHEYDHAVPPLDGFRHEWGSVQTLRYGEWLVNVPLLLLIAGHVVLGRPISEILQAVAVTNLYIVISWASLVVTSAILRWLLIVLAFGLYFWATYDMARWVQRYLREAPARLPGKYGRVSLIAWLNLMFVLYGVIFLLDAFGWVGTRSGHAMYEICDCTAKTVTSFLLAVHRSRERCHAMKVLVAVHSRMARASLSVLRSSFDYIIPCKLDDSGNCIVLEARNADVKAIETLTGKPLAGNTFADAFNSQRDRDLFAYQMQIGLHQEGNDLAADLQSCREVMSKGMSFWASRPLPNSTISLAPTFNYDLSNAIAHANGQSIIPVSIHLSSAVGMSTERDSGPQMLIALRLMAEQDLLAQDASTPPSFTAVTSMQSPVQPPSSNSASSWSKWAQKQRVPGEVIVENGSVCTSMSSHRSAKLIRIDALSDLPSVKMRRSSSSSRPGSRPDPMHPLRESFFSSGLSDCSKDSLLQYSEGWFSSLLTDGPVKMDCATQTANIQLEERSTQTSILGSDTGFRCTCCARPPLLPQTPGRAPPSGIQRQHRGLRKSSRKSKGRASPASPRSTDVDKDVAHSSSSSNYCATNAFDGCWILTDMSPSTAAFMSALWIEGCEVTDAEGTVSYLRQDQSTGNITYEGGALFFEDDCLIRVGKSGRYYRYLRGLEEMEASDQDDDGVQAPGHMEG